MKKIYFFILLGISLCLSAQKPQPQICYAKNKTGNLHKRIESVLKGDSKFCLKINENYKITHVGTKRDSIKAVTENLQVNILDISDVVKNDPSARFIHYRYTKRKGNSEKVVDDSVALDRTAFNACLEECSNNECKNQIDNIKYILDLCQEDVCSGTKLPALICNDKTVFNRKLKLPHRSMLSFGIINNNPFRYTYSINQNKLAFNTDATSFLERMDKFMAEQTNRAVVKGTASENMPNKDTAKGKEISLIPVESLKREVETILKESEKLLEDLKVYSSTIAIQQCLSKDEIESKLHEFTNRYMKITGSSMFQSKIEGLIKKLNSLDQPKKGDNKVDSILILNAISQLQKYTSKDIEKGLTQLLKGTYNYALLPIQVSDDNVDAIELEVQQEDQLTGKTVSYKYAFYISGGIKIDFSAGPFISTLTDHKYKLNDKYVMRQRDDNMSYALASLMHVYFRTTSHFNAGLYLGVGVTDDQRANLMSGVSLMFGRKDRVCLNGGVVFGKVKRLSQPYQIGSEYTGKDEIPVVDVYKMGWSIGITYNLTKPKVLKPDNQ